MTKASEAAVQADRGRRRLRHREPDEDQGPGGAATLAEQRKHCVEHHPQLSEHVQDPGAEAADPVHGLILLVYRLGSHVPTPGIDREALRAVLRAQSRVAARAVRHVLRRHLSNATIFALGIMPYISASIILQLLQAVVPYFEKLAKEGEEGRKKITQYTRYGTVVLAADPGVRHELPAVEQSPAASWPNPGIGLHAPDHHHADRGHHASSCGWASRSPSAASATASR